MTRYEAFCLLTLVLASMLNLQIAPVAARDYEVGLEAGNWAQYTVLGGWDTTDNTIPMPQAIKDARNTEWINMTVESIGQKTVTVARETLFRNYTRMTALIWGNVETGAGDLNYTVIAKDLNVGDKITAGELAVKILSSKIGTYANAERVTNYSNTTEYTITGSRGYEFRWDRQTGIATEMRFFQVDTSDYHRTLSSIIITLQRTNLWKEGSSANSDNSFISSLTIILLVTGAIAIAAILTAYSLSRPRFRRSKLRKSTARKQRVSSGLLEEPTR